MHGLEFIADLIARGEVETADGRRLPLHSGTSLSQCQFIQEQLRAVNARVTLEIGLAYGLSAIAICDKLRGKAGALHHVIDPFQNTASWDGVGLENLRRNGLQDHFKFYCQTAEECLPSLASSGLQLDFAYIDAGKRLDDTLVYSTYVMKMLRVGGRVVFDDAGFPGIRQALRYLSQDIRYRVVASQGPDGFSWRRRILELAASVPGAGRVLSPELMRSSRSLQVAAHCVVLEKVSDAEPDWKWHPQF